MVFGSRETNKLWRSSIKGEFAFTPLKCCTKMRLLGKTTQVNIFPMFPFFSLLVWANIGSFCDVGKIGE